MAHIKQKLLLKLSMEMSLVERSPIAELTVPIYINFNVIAQGLWVNPSLGTLRHHLVLTDVRNGTIKVVALFHLILIKYVS